MNLRKKAFTLVEMLVVIMIISLLAAALFPAIQAAIDSAKATAAKNKGRGIWIGIVSANAEREPLGLGLLWPGSNNGLQWPVGGTTNLANNPAFYFSALMACDGNGTPASDMSLRITSDLNPSMLGGLDWGARADGTFPADGTALAWNMLNVSDSAPSEDAFLFSRNINFGAKGSASTSNTIATLSGNVSISKTRGMIVTRGGGCFDRKKLYLTGSALITTTNSYAVWTDD